MNEIFSNEVSELSLSVTVRGEPVAPMGLPTAKLYLSNTVDFPLIGEDLTVFPILDSISEFRIPIPFSSVKGKRYAKVVYEYELPGHGVISKDEGYEIRTRILSFEEFKQMMDDPDIEFDSFNVAETEARLVMESYCHQSLSRWSGGRSVVGNPDKFYLPQYMSKLMNVTELSEELEIEYFDSNDYILESTGLSIRREYNNRTRGLRNLYVTGEWGFSILPDAIKKAAYELTRSFSNTSINDRRQFLLNSGGGGLTGMEESSDFISYKAYQDSTGNPIADQLLGPYRIITPGII